MEFEVAKKEFGVVKTESFLFNNTKEAKCKAAVPFETATQYLTPQYLEIASSNSFILWVFSDECYSSTAGRFDSSFTLVILLSLLLR